MINTATAKYCPECGRRLDKNGKCPNRNCPFYGKVAGN